MGCGTEVDAVALAQRGWQVTAADLVPRALAAAARRAAAAGVSPRFVHADVTRLDPASVGEGFDLVVDLGCYHKPAGRSACRLHRGGHRGRRPGGDDAAYGAAAVLPGRVGQGGVTLQEVSTRFGPGWEVVAEPTRAQSLGIPAVADRVTPWRYQLRQRGGVR